MPPPRPLSEYLAQLRALSSPAPAAPEHPRRAAERLAELARTARQRADALAERTGDERTRELLADLARHAQVLVEKANAAAEALARHDVAERQGDLFAREGTP